MEARCWPTAWQLALGTAFGAFSTYVALGRWVRGERRKKPTYLPEPAPRPKGLPTYLP